jgi:pilus assembly protein Flp/PilA
MMFRAMLLFVQGAALERCRAWAASDERGQTLVEYGLLLFFIAIVVIAALLILGPTISGIFQSVNDQI